MTIILIIMPLTMMLTMLMLEVTLNGPEEREITLTLRKDGISTSCQATHIPERRISKKKKRGGRVQKWIIWWEWMRNHFPVLLEDG